MTVKEMGKRGGLARAKKMTAEQRSVSAKKAARARWKKKRVKSAGHNFCQNDKVGGFVVQKNVS